MGNRGFIINISLLEPLFNKYGKSFSENETIFNQGDPSNYFYIIYDGKIKIVMEDFDKEKNEKLETIINILEKGEMFGELSIIDKKPRSASAIALVETKLIELNEEMFSILMEGQKVFVSNILDIMINRVSKLSEIVSKLSKKDGKTRFLISLSNYIKSKIDRKACLINTMNLSCSELVKNISKDINMSEKEVAKYIEQYKHRARMNIDEENNYIMIEDIKKALDLIKI